MTSLAMAVHANDNVQSNWYYVLVQLEGDTEWKCICDSSSYVVCNGTLVDFTAMVHARNGVRVARAKVVMRNSHIPSSVVVAEENAKE